ncbi:hypothetical protein V8E36_009565 [Tilletia maclaganii]
MQSTSYGGTPMAPSPSSPGVSRALPDPIPGLQQRDISDSTDDKEPLSEASSTGAEGSGLSITGLDETAPSEDLSSDKQQLNTDEIEAVVPKSLSPPPESVNNEHMTNGSAPGLAQAASEADSQDPPAFASNGESSDTSATTPGDGGLAKAETNAAAASSSSTSEPAPSTAASADSSATGSSASLDGGGTISAATGAAVAASLSSNTSTPAAPLPSTPSTASSSLSAGPSPSPTSSISASANSAGSVAAGSNPRLVYPALHLFPLNNTFVPKCINLNPPGPQNRVKIGRQTTAKTAPNPTNGYFDSKVLSRAHAEIWSKDGKIYIKDVKSSNGTFINGERLSAEGHDSDDFELHSEDHVEFGIDIVSEDGRVVLHHKVACRVYVVITAEDAVNLHHDIANGYVGVNPRPASGGPGSDRAGVGGTMGGAGAGAGYGGPGGTDASRRGGVAMTGGAGKLGGNMMNFDQVLTRLQSELKQSREAAAELNSISSVFQDIHETLAGGLPPLQQPPYQHLVPEAEYKSQPNPAAHAATRASESANAAEAEAAAAAKAASEAAATAATKAKEEAEAKLAATTAQAAEQAQTVNQLQAQLSETQASLAEHIAKMRGLEEMLMEHEHLKGEVDALRRLVADVNTSPTSSGSKDGNGLGSGVPPALGWIPPPPLPSSLFSSAPPLPNASSAHHVGPPPPPPHRHNHNLPDAEPELELFDAFKARASRKTPAMLAEEEERMRVLDQREREVEAERRRLALESGTSVSTPTAEDGGASSLLGGSAADEEHDFDDGASVASVDTVVPGSPPPAPKPSSSLPLADEDDLVTLGDAPKPPAGMDEVEASRFGAGGSSTSVPMRRKREESAPGLLQIEAAGVRHATDADGSRWMISSDGKGNRRVWPAGRNGGLHGDDEDEDDDDDDDDDDDGMRKNGHVGPLAPPDMPPGLSYDGSADHWNNVGFGDGTNGTTRMTRAQLLEENSKLQARLASLEELLSEALALGRSLAPDSSADGHSGFTPSPDGTDAEDSPVNVKIEGGLAKAEPVEGELLSSTRSKDTKGRTTLQDSTDVDAHVRSLEARITTLETEMDRRVAEVESEILRETQAKWELWRAQVEQGMQLERDSWERDHGRIFRKVAGDRAAAAAAGQSGADHENEQEEDDEQSARSASSGGTGDTDLSSSSGSAASTNATSPPSSIADSVGRFGKSLLGGTSHSSPSSSLRSGVEGDVDKAHGPGRTDGGKGIGGTAAAGGATADEKRGGGDGSASTSGPGARGNFSKPFMFSENSATMPALSTAGAIIVAVAVMAFAAKSAGPHK